MLYDFGIKTAIQLSGNNKPWVPAAWYVSYVDKGWEMKVIPGAWPSFANGNYPAKESRLDD